MTSVLAAWPHLIACDKPLRCVRSLGSSWTDECMPVLLTPAKYNWARRRGPMLRVRRTEQTAIDRIARWCITWPSVGSCQRVSQANTCTVHLGRRSDDFLD